MAAVDPAVSRAKFDRQIRDFRRLASDYRQRGWFLADAAFPIAMVVLAAPQLKPSPLVVGVRFDFTDYDLRPPSVRLVNPFTAEPYLAKDLPVPLLRQAPAENIQIQVLGQAAGPVAKLMARQPLMQAYGQDDIPFLCVAGVREYHDHPAHSGDTWELQRSSGAGSIVRILEIVDRYGIRPLSGFNVVLEPRIAGFAQNEVPE